MSQVLFDRKAFDSKVERHLERWRKMMTSSTSTNRDMAENAVNQLYLKVKGKKPKAILWCESPLQLAVFPWLVGFFLCSPQAGKLHKMLKATGVPGSSEWEKEWQRYISLCDEKSYFENTIASILEDAKMNPVTQGTLTAAATAFKKLLHDLFMLDSIEPQALFTPAQKFGGIAVLAKTISQLSGKRPAGFASVMDGDFLENLVSVQSQIEQAVGIRLPLNASVAAMSTALGKLRLRTISEFVPTMSSLNIDPRNINKNCQFRDLWTKCVELNNLANWLYGWFYHSAIPSWPRNANGRIHNHSSSDSDGLFQEMAEFFNQTVNTATEQIETWKGNVEFFVSKIGKDRATHTALWLPYGAPFLAFALACKYIDEFSFGPLQEEIDCWAYLSHGASGYLFCSNICFVCAKPISMRTNENGRPHNADGPAAIWSDGFSVYSWRGVTVEKELIENKKMLTLKRIQDEKNAEVRRVMIDIYGEARYIQDSAASVIEENELGVLYRLQLPNDEPIVMVRVRNSTPENDGTYKCYYLRVPPNMQTVRQAIAWTFGLEEHQYNPDFES